MKWYPTGLTVGANIVYHNIDNPKFVRLNIGKCKAESYGRRPEICTNYNISGEYKLKVLNI